MIAPVQIDLALLTQIATPVIEGAGYELVDLEWKRESGVAILRLFIDRPGGPHPAGEGITLDGCAEVATELSTVLDVAEALPGSDTYSLEVSSPGLDRPLRREPEFRRAIGQKIKMKTLHALGPSPGRRNYAGVLTEVAKQDLGVTLFVDVGDRVCEVPLDEVEKANLVYEFDKSAWKASAAPAGKARSTSKSPARSR